MKRSWARLFSIILGVLVLQACNVNLPTKVPVANKGIIDLQLWDFDKNGSVELNGKWEFYWQNHLIPQDFAFPDNLPDKQWVDVPGGWHTAANKNLTVSAFGYATYRLRIALPKTTPEKLGLKLPSLRTSGKIFINGREVFQVGVPGKNKKETVPEYHPEIIDISPDWSELEIIIQLSNFHYRKTGLIHPVILGEWKSVTQNRLRHLLFSMCLIGIILFAGIYHLGLFWLRRKSFAVLYFGIFCMLLCMRNLVIGERIILEVIKIPWEILVKMEYSGFYAAIGVFTLFCYTIFPKEIHLLVVRITVLLSGFGALLTIFTPPLLFTYVVEFFQILSLLAGAYVTVAVVRANLSRRKSAQIFMTGWLVLFSTVVNDILFANGLVTTGHLFSLGFIVFILFQTYLLMARFSQTFRQSEKLAEELNATNKNLEKIVAEKTDSLLLANQRLSQRQKAMRENLEEIRNINDQLTENSLELRGQLSAINRTLGFVEISPQGKILEVNSIFSYTTGFERETLIGKDHLTLLNPDELNKDTYEKFWSDLSKGIPASGESKFIAQNKTELWFATSYTPIIDQQGQINKIILLTNDITAQKRQNQEFEAQYKAINQLNAAMEFDLEGNVIKANELFLNLIDYELDEIKGVNLLDLIEDTLYTNADFQEFWSRLLDNEFAPGEFLFQTKTKQQVWIAGAYNVVKDLNGSPQKVLTLSHDITKSKKIAQEYKKLSLVASKSNNAVVITDAQGIVEWVNEGFTKISGYTLNEIVGKKPGELLNGPETDTKIVEEVRQKVKEGKAGNVDVVGYNKQGQKYWVNLSFTPVFDDRGKLTNFINIETDITAQKKVEEEILRAKKRTEEIYAITTDTSKSVEEQSQEILKYAINVLCMEIGVIGEVRGSQYTVVEVISKDDTIAKEQVFNLEELYCEITWKENRMVVFDSVHDTSYCSHPGFIKFKLTAYIGVPIWVDGEIFGTLSFSSTKALDQPITQGQKDFVLLLAEWIGAALSRLHHEQRLTIINEEVSLMNNILNEQNKLLDSKNQQLEGQSAAIQDQYHVIKDSIEYAQRIQAAILPPIEKIQKVLPESFVLYQPRDLVSGDLYWFAEKTELGQDKVILAVLDCTGHGVPGAFMSMIGNDLLNQVVHDKEIHAPEIILQEVHRLICQVLQQGEVDIKDGMDIGIVTIDKKAKTLEFAGAKHSLMIVKDGILEIIRGDRLPLGGERPEEERTFKKYSLAFPEIPGTLRLYMATDGYPDQFGGPKGRKFMTLRFRELLREIHQEPMAKQHQILSDTLSGWMAHSRSDNVTYEQIDDILVMGVCL